MTDERTKIRTITVQTLRPSPLRGGSIKISSAALLLGALIVNSVWKSVTSTHCARGQMADKQFKCL